MVGPTTSAAGGTWMKGSMMARVVYCVHPIHIMCIYTHTYEPVSEVVVLAKLPKRVSLLGGVPIATHDLRTCDQRGTNLRKEKKETKRKGKKKTRKGKKEKQMGIAKVSLILPPAFFA